MRKAIAVAALREQRTATISLLASLPDAAWQHAVCTSAGDAAGVHGLAAHLVVADEALLVSRWLSGREGARRLASVIGWHDGGVAAWANASPGEVLAALARHGDRVAALVRATPSGAVNVAARGTQGRRQFLLQALYRRVFHEFAHSDDMAVAAGVVDDLKDPSRPVAAALAFTVLQRLPVQVLPAVAADAGVVRLVVDPAAADDRSPQLRHAAVAEPLPPLSAAPPVTCGRQTWSFDFARKHYGPRVSARPDAVVVAAAGPLALLHAGRRAWRELAPAQLSITGDHELAALLLDAVARPPPAGSCVVFSAA